MIVAILVLSDYYVDLGDSGGYGESGWYSLPGESGDSGDTGGSGQSGKSGDKKLYERTYDLFV